MKPGWIKGYSVDILAQFCGGLRDGLRGPITVRYPVATVISVFQTLQIGKNIQFMSGNPAGSPNGLSDCRISWINTRPPAHKHKSARVADLLARLFGIKRRSTRAALSTSLPLHGACLVVADGTSAASHQLPLVCWRRARRTYTPTYTWTRSPARGGTPRAPLQPQRPTATRSLPLGFPSEVAR
jgi:hypothetical protein